MMLVLRLLQVLARLLLDLYELIELVREMLVNR